MKISQTYSELVNKKIFVLKYQDEYVTYDPVLNQYGTTQSIDELHFWDWQVDQEVYSTYERGTYDVVRCNYWETHYLLTGKIFLVQKLIILFSKIIRCKCV